MSEPDTTVLPPSDNAAEQCVLGGCLLSPSAIAGVTAVLTAEDFYRPNHGTIFTAITQLVQANEPVDPVTVSGKLQQMGELERIGGLPYLMTLYQAPPSAANTSYYAKQVAGKAKMRRLGELGVRLQQIAHSETSGEDDVNKGLAEGEKFFRELSRGSSKALDWDGLVAKWRAEQAVNTAPPFPTPWPQLNQWLNGGVRRGELVIIAGRPGEGKSVGALNIIQYTAELGYSSVAFSVEMNQMAVMNRLIASGAQVKLKNLIQREFDLETEAKIDAFFQTNQGLMLEVVDQERITVEQIIAHCRTKKKLDMVSVDYAQLLTPTDSKIDRRLQVAHITRSLKIAAGELNVGMIVAAQLNRGNVKDGTPRAPVVSDIGESGNAEQDADVVLLLNRDTKDEGVVQVIVAKNRNGRKGTLEMRFQGAHARMGE